MVYLLHFDRPLRHARHYLGEATTESVRELAFDGFLPENRGPLLNAAIAAGIRFIVARVWPGDAAVRRRIRALGPPARLCPICRCGKPDKEAPSVLTVQTGAVGGL